MSGRRKRRPSPCAPTSLPVVPPKPLKRSRPSLGEQENPSCTKRPKSTPTSSPPIALVRNSSQTQTQVQPQPQTSVRVAQADANPLQHVRSTTTITSKHHGIPPPPTASRATPIHTSRPVQLAASTPVTVTPTSNVVNKRTLSLPVNSSTSSQGRRTNSNPVVMRNTSSTPMGTNKLPIPPPPKPTAIPIMRNSAPRTLAIRPTTSRPIQMQNRAPIRTQVTPILAKPSVRKPQWAPVVVKSANQVRPTRPLARTPVLPQSHNRVHVVRPTPNTSQPPVNSVNNTPGLVLAHAGKPPPAVVTAINRGVIITQTQAQAQAQVQAEAQTKAQAQAQAQARAQAQAQLRAHAAGLRNAQVGVVKPASAITSVPLMRKPTPTSHASTGADVNAAPPMARVHTGTDTASKAPSMHQIAASVHPSPTPMHDNTSKVPGVADAGRSAALAAISGKPTAPAAQDVGQQIALSHNHPNMTGDYTQVQNIRRKIMYDTIIANSGKAPGVADAGRSNAIAALAAKVKRNKPIQHIVPPRKGKGKPVGTGGALERATGRAVSSIPALVSRGPRAKRGKAAGPASGVLPSLVPLTVEPPTTASRAGYALLRDGEPDPAVFIKQYFAERNMEKQAVCEELSGAAQAAEAARESFKQRRSVHDDAEWAAKPPPQADPIRKARQHDRRLSNNRRSAAATRVYNVVYDAEVVARLDKMWDLQRDLAEKLQQKQHHADEARRKLEQTRSKINSLQRTKNFNDSIRNARKQDEIKEFQRRNQIPALFGSSQDSLRFGSNLHNSQSQDNDLDPISLNRAETSEELTFSQEMNAVNEMFPNHSKK